MTERPNVAVLKTAVRLAHRGFESPSLRSSTAIPTKAHQGVMSQVSLAAFSLPVCPVTTECNLMILQPESQSRIVLVLRLTISAMTSTSIARELGSSLGFNSMFTP